MKSSTGKDENITTAGIITNLRVLKSKKGDFYAQGTLEDMAGSVEMLVFPEAYRKAAGKGEAGSPGADQGWRAHRGRRESQAHSQRHLFRWKTPKSRCRGRLRIRIPLETAHDATVDALHTLFTERKGEAKVLFDVEREGDFMVVMEAEGYNVLPDRNFIARVEELCGRGAVRVID